MPDCLKGSTDDAAMRMFLQIDEGEDEGQVFSDEHHAPDITHVCHVAQNLQSRHPLRFLAALVYDLSWE